MANPLVIGLGDARTLQASVTAHARDVRPVLALLAQAGAVPDVVRALVSLDDVTARGEVFAGASGRLGRLELRDLQLHARQAVVLGRYRAEGSHRRASFLFRLAGKLAVSRPSHARGSFGWASTLLLVVRDGLRDS